MASRIDPVWRRLADFARWKWHQKDRPDEVRLTDLIEAAMPRRIEKEKIAGTPGYYG
jgi:hypothetical protein